MFMFMSLISLCVFLFVHLFLVHLFLCIPSSMRVFSLAGEDSYEIRLINPIRLISEYGLLLHE